MEEPNQTSERWSALRCEREVYRFESFELELFPGELRHHGRTIALTTKSLGVLAHLVRNRDRVVPRNELLAALWPGVRVSTGSLSQAIWEIRHALGQASGSQRFIQTLRGRGYRFVARAEVEIDPALAEASRPNVRDGHDFAAALERWCGKTLPLGLGERIRGLNRDVLLTFMEFASLFQDGSHEGVGPDQTRQ